MAKLHRRDFIKASLFGGIAVAAIPTFAMKALAEQTKVAVDTNARVSLVTGADRADMAFSALQPFSKEIAQAAGNRRIIVKPNMVSSTVQLSATHRDTLEGILEFYKSIKKLENVVISESAADGPTMAAYDNYKYIPLAEKYKVKLIDMDESPFKIFYVVDELDIQPKAIRMASTLADGNSFVMSVARMKTHDRVVATLSLKNIIAGAPVKDIGFSYGKDRVAGTTSDKGLIHGNGFRGINFNLFSMASHLHPDLAFIDGYEGMEGDGPIAGTPIDHKVCVAGLDWLAVDRVGIELMGIDPATVGYMNFCANAGMGQFDLNKIEIIGEKIANHIKTYKLSHNIDKQLQWMTPVGV